MEKKLRRPRRPSRALGFIGPPTLWSVNKLRDAISQNNRSLHIGTTPGTKRFKNYT